MSFMDKFIDDVERDRERERLMEKVTLLEERLAVVLAELNRVNGELARMQQ